MSVSERTRSDGRPAWLPYREYPFESRFLQLEGDRVHYIDEGSGPVLLLVHAGPSWSFVFRGVVARLRVPVRLAGFPRERAVAGGSGLRGHPRLCVSSSGAIREGPGPP